jgi:hypothetical protein
MKDLIGSVGVQLSADSNSRESRIGLWCWPISAAAPGVRRSNIKQIIEKVSRDFDLQTNFAGMSDPTGTRTYGLLCDRD